MDEVQELDPCPFCSGPAEIERRGNRRQSTIYACTMCGCRLETGEEFNHGWDWNNRLALTVSPEKLEAAASAIFGQGGNHFADSWETLDRTMADSYRGDARAAAIALGLKVE